MAISRIFLGWDHHLLHGARDYFAKRFTHGQKLDLQGVTVVFPGARAGRRLTELFVEYAEQHELRFYPPRSITMGVLPEILYTPTAPLAGDLARMMAWFQALQDSDDVLQELMPTIPSKEDLGAWLGLVQQMLSLSDELGAAGLSCAEVAARGPELDLFHDERWGALAAIEARYEAQLLQRGTIDRNSERRRALAEGRITAPGPIFLIGVADMNPLLHALLRTVSGEITALIYADKAIADRFDDLGSIAVPQWLDAPLPIAQLTLEVTHGPRDAAQAVLDVIDRTTPQPSPEEVTVGIADPTLGPVIAETLAAEGLPTFRAEGSSITSTAPLTFLDIAGRYAASGSAHDLRSLVRHPDVQQWLRDAPGVEAQERWILLDSIGVLDRYHERHLQDQIRGSAYGDSSVAEYARRITGLTDELVAELFGAKRALPQWAGEIAAVVARLYGERKLNRFAEKDALVLHGIEALQGALTEIFRFDAPELPPVSAAEAMRLIVKLLGSRTAELTKSGAAIEILGWLELPFDDAREIIVTGFNEGFVPESLNSDPFLPESLRRNLGILHNERRYARDAFALTALAEGPARVTLIQSRRSSSGDPLKPSRLLLAGEPVDAARIIESFYRPLADRGEPAHSTGPSEFVVPPPPKRLDTPVTEMTVSQFKSYLQCPYRFYLRHLLGLQRHDDSGYELSPLDFGVLAHTVLKHFAESDVVGSTDEQSIARFLEEELRRQAERAFGRSVLPVVFIQTRQLLTRLRHFATWQAGWSAAGWRIEKTELTVTAGEVQLDLGAGQPMTVVGRLDRLDRNSRTGEWAIFDYKVSDGELDARRAHLHPSKGWLDLQLPLYHLAFEKKGLGESAQLGYILLSATGKELVSFADFTRAELDEAVTRATDIARAVRAETFFPPTKELLPGDDFSALCGIAQFHLGGTDGGAA